MEKEYIPYSSRMRMPFWPDGKTLAIGIYLAVEDWDEEAGDDYSTPPPLAPPLLPHMKRPDMGIQSSIEYGFRVGVWRLLDVFERHDVKVTIIGSGLAAERHSELFSLFATKGFDFFAHGYYQSRLYTELSREEQAKDIDHCMAVFKKVTGAKVPGFGAPWARQNQSTLEILADRGFVYHAGLHDDELPYTLHFGQRTLTEVPYRITESGEINDYWMYASRDCKVGAEAFEYCRAIIDARYQDSANRPQLLVIGNHPEVAGRPDRADTLSKVIAYIKTLPNVWLTTLGGMATHWGAIAPNYKDKLVKEPY